MKEIDITRNTGLYASKWSISDFYEEAEKDLREVLASGEDFDTGWFGCKKEINYAQIVRCEGEITVSVTCHMDDLWDEQDLIYDALWETTKVEKELPQEIIDSIRDAACDEQLDDHSTATTTLPWNASFEDLVAALDKLEAEADADNSVMYKALCDLVLAHVEYMKENGIQFVDDENGQELEE